MNNGCPKNAKFPSDSQQKFQKREATNTKPSLNGLDGMSFKTMSDVDKMHT